MALEQIKYRKYWVATNAWWKGHLNDKSPEIYFGIYPEGGGTSGEMSVVWKIMHKNGCDGESQLYPELQCFDDGWKALSMFPDLLEEMGKVDSKKISPEDFIEILKKCKFKELKHNER